jgi:hypothetical protein
MEICPIKFDWEEFYPIFLSERYLKAIDDHYGWLGGFSHGDLTFVLPFSWHRKYVFTIGQFQSPTLYVENPIIPDSDERTFLNETMKFLQAQHFNLVQKSPMYCVFNSFPDNAVVAPFGSYYINLFESKEKLWSNFSRNHKRMIRNTEKDVSIESGKNNFNIAYELIEYALNKSNMIAPDKSDMVRLLRSLNKNVEIFIAFNKDQPQGTAFIVFSNFGAHVLYAGGMCNHLLHWEVMKYFKDLGVHYYDFVGARINPKKGSKLEGIQRFKSGFGSRMKTGYIWRYHFNTPQGKVVKFLNQIIYPKGDLIDNENTADYT